MRTLGSGTTTQTTTQGAYPGYLVEITMNDGGVIRLTSLDVAFQYPPTTGPSFLSADLDVQGLSWSGGTAGTATLTLGDGDLAYWTYAALGRMRDAVVKVWNVYAGALGEATPLFYGRMGVIKKGVLSLECSLSKDTTLKSSPRRRVQNLIPSKYLLPAGKVMWPGNWVLVRQ